MGDKAKRLAGVIKELRGTLSQNQFSKKLGVGRSTVNFWESGQAYPDPSNLQKLAHLKAWSLEELQSYLLHGELPTEDPVEQMLRKIRTLPSESVAQVAAFASATLAERIGDKELLLKSVV